jgi:beta-glucuronidase
MNQLKMLVLLLTVAFAVPVSLNAQSKLIANVINRQTVNLDGQWKFIVDPYDTGEGQKYFKDAKPASKSDLLEYSFDAAGSLKVPGDWNTQSERLFFYEGAIWYRRIFDYQQKPRSRVFVYFGAANYRADVYLNGTRIGQHEGGFTPFNFEITQLVKPDNNSLVVKVDSTRLKEGVPYAGNRLVELRRTNTGRAVS